MNQEQPFWSKPIEQALADVRSSPAGLSATEAEARLRDCGPNAIDSQRRAGALLLFLAQLRSPLVLILVFAAAISAFVHEWLDAAIIIAIVLGSAALSFVQEYRAGAAVARLHDRVTVKAGVLRDGKAQSLPARAIVPGDIVLLAAGSLVPADGLLVEANSCFVNQAVLTGESLPVEKQPGLAAPGAPLTERDNCLFQGTSVRSGTARMLVVNTGPRTLFGAIARRLELRPPETEFERGIHRFGAMLTQIMLALVLVVFAINVFAAKPAIDSLLFAIALAVGISPELLPAIISITLAHGAQTMAARGVIVRRLNAIENFGSMDVLCTDKTGTLTVGVVRLEAAVDPAGQPAAPVLRAALANASLQNSLGSPLDDAIAAYAQAHGCAAGELEKLGEIPYDFTRKRVSVIARGAGEPPELIAKGALAQLLAVCEHVSAGGGSAPLDAAQRQQIEARFAEWSASGLRVLGVGTRQIAPRPRYCAADEAGLTLLGFLLFADPPKPGVAQAVSDLARLGVQLKIISGDNQRVSRHVAAAVGLPAESVLTGAELNAMPDEALWQRAEHTSLFVDVDPNQKERIILALRKTGHVVGYMGDGINDAPALHAADVGISVDTAVDVAKDAADFVLLEQNLDVLRQGIEEGRRTFANTLKYVFTTTSANFGNMFSMAGASLFLPFLPLLAKQILLNNFLSDLPGTAIASDNVDREWIERPQRWDIPFIRRFMVVFGLLSSLFDYLTFGALLLLAHGDAVLFRTGWFVESLLTELVIALVVRTRQLCFRSRPGRLLATSTALVLIVTLALPYLPTDRLLGFTPLPPELMALVLAIPGLYVAAAEVAKRVFYASIRERS